MKLSLPYSDKLKQILSYSREEAMRLHNKSIEPEHLMLGIIRDGENHAFRILQNELLLNVQEYKHNLEDNLKQYAIHGYDVDAIGFVVKPITQYDFDVVMDKVVRRIEAGISRDITVKTANGMSRLKINDIYYIEVIKHKLIFHTVFGLVESWGTLVTTEKMLPARSFSRCNVCYLVNLRHVQSVDRETVTVCGESLKIARSRKREFMMDLARYEGTMEG